MNYKNQNKLNDKFICRGWFFKKCLRLKLTKIGLVANLKGTFKVTNNNLNQH